VHSPRKIEPDQGEACIQTLTSDRSLEKTAMAYPDDLPTPPRDKDESGSIWAWSLTGLGLVFGYILVLVLLRPHP
jgi:hypothetical protein